jgi:hypothetical protein
VLYSLVGDKNEKKQQTKQMLPVWPGFEAVVAATPCSERARSAVAVPQHKLGNHQKQQSSQQQQGAEEGEEQSFCTDGCDQSKGNLEKPKYRGKLYLQSSV